MVDILVVALIFYWILSLLRGTTGMTLLRGIVMLLVGAFFLGYVLQLTMFNWLLRNSLTALLVAIPILFQPELRRAVERVGRTGIRPVTASPAVDQLIDTLGETCRRLSERRWGALIVLEQETGLQDYTATGTIIDAVASTELLLSIFLPGTPLHDGAVLIREGRLLAAGCVLPLSEVRPTDPALGTRHRAGLGISEQTGAIVIVVSEETGIISIAHNGRMARNLDDARLRRLLRGLIGVAPSSPAVALLQPHPQEQR
ncbi:MAG: TIGR00159 family protein [Chloroflexi bacterium]|nr:TIGR00159 family protein [Chloroflexota bacterium]